MNKEFNGGSPEVAADRIMANDEPPIGNAPYCDPETGVCNIMSSEQSKTTGEDEEVTELTRTKPIQMVYVTDPICSYCWQVEPQLEKFTTLYGEHMDVKVVMGGLLESWHGFADEGNGIRKPSDVGAHWREAAAHFGMPIDGTVWDKEPIESSYPASRAFKLVQQISDTSSRRFLRAVREEVMVFNRNVAKDEVLINILDRANRNGKKVVADTKGEEANALLNADLALARSLGATSFPTVLLINSDGEGVRIAGMRDFETYEKALFEIAGEELEIAPLPELKDMFNISRHIFFKEIEVMYDLEPSETEAFIGHNLPENTYEVREILGSKYIVRKEL